MPRIRVITSSGEERIVRTPNCSTLTVTLLARSQRPALELRADAKLVGGEDTLEHWVWDFSEVQQPARIELISESSDRYDPPDSSGSDAPTPLTEQPAATAELRAIEAEMKSLEASLKGYRFQVARDTCSFCGRPKDEVNRMIAGPVVMICDDCIIACNALLDK